MARASYYFDMDGVLANFHKEKYSYTNATSKEWIANLEPFMNNVELVRTMIASGKSVYINSLAASENAKQGKLEWLAKYIPELKANHIIIIVGNGKKADYMRTKKGVLVDDKLANCKQWEKMTGCKSVWVEVKGGTIAL